MNQNRHFQIKHDSNGLNCLATFQKLINNFPDIRCSSTENITAVDQESIDKKAKELKKYMSSSISHSQRVKTCKSSRDNRYLPYEDTKSRRKELASNLSDPAFSQQQIDAVFRTSIVLPKDCVASGPRKSEHYRRLSGIKLSACQLNKALPFQKLNQVPDTPSVEFDINDCYEDDEVQLSAVSEEILFE